MTPRQLPDANLLTFHIENTSGLSPYLQLVQQITHALRLGRLKMGDRLPTVRDVASNVAINPNTVLKAYRHLEVQGLLVSRPGKGVFVARELAGPSAQDQGGLSRARLPWCIQAGEAGVEVRG